MAEAPIPREAKIVSLILKSVGVDECEPKVIQQFLELMYRHSVEVLQDAMLYGAHAGRHASNEINSQDIRLALQTKVNHSFAPPPPREFLVDLAAKKNLVPLAIIPEDEGNIRLPPEKNCLIAANYKLTSQAIQKVASRGRPFSQEDHDFLSQKRKLDL